MTNEEGKKRLEILKGAFEKVKNEPEINIRMPVNYQDNIDALEKGISALSQPQPDIEAIRKEIEKQKIMVSGSYLTKDQQSVFRNAINVALAVIDKHIQKGESE